MEGSRDGSPQSSMCMVKAAELFPKPVLEKEEDKLTVRFAELAGESVKYLGKTDEGVLALSNYRLFLFKNSTGAETSVPLLLIESTQIRDLFQLIISCKDASTVKCSFATSEQCAEWQRRISLSVGVPETLESLFAFPFHAWASESPTLNQDNEWYGRLQRVGNYDDDFRKEVERLQFDLHGAWRISHANAEFKLCTSYPRLLLVPACISDDTLQNVASFRSSRRIPAVVWRHERTGAVIARCSQPEVGWLGWRNSKDEQLLKALSDACSFDRGTQGSRTRHNSSASSESSPPSPEGSHEEVDMEEPKKILIVDARSYTSAVTNRARGGGCECAEYYPSAEIQFMSLGNIHVIRKSFHALRQLCSSQPDIQNWLSLLERTMWLQHMSGLLAASMVVCHAIERSGRPVLVHCSDGWDRTPQIVATAQLCLDPYYRTIEGFRVLVEREWLSFGHKFSDRCGHGPGSDEPNERCPVFLQWLDCVHQIHRQFPCSFEFDMGYLIKLAQHSHSCLFGTFLCNTVKERLENSVPDRTFSVWPFLSGPMYKNHLYVPNRERVLWPAHSVRDLRLWTEVYLGSWGGNQSSADYPANGEAVASSQEVSGSMTKTRSYGDLMTGVNAGGLTRRSSDPNMAVDSSILGGTLDLSQENSIDSNLSSDREISPDLIDPHTTSLAMIKHTTQKLQSLTQELNQSDDELENTIKNAKHAAAAAGAANGSASSLFINGNSDSYNFQPIVPEQPTEAGTPPSPAPASNTPSPLQRHHLVDDIDENTARIIKVESYVGGDDVIDGGGRRNSLRIAKPIPATEVSSTTSVVGAGLSAVDMMESVDLSGKSPSPPALSTLAQSSIGNLWHGSVETSTDTLVPLDQYSSPKRIIQLSESSSAEEEPQGNNTTITSTVTSTTMLAATTHNRSSSSPMLETTTVDGNTLSNNSISLDIASNGNMHDHKDLYVSKSDFAATQTGDSNGCDLFSDSKAYDRKNFSESDGTNQNTTPNEQVESRVRSILSDVQCEIYGGPLPTQATAMVTPIANGISSNASNKFTKIPNLMDESIIIQPQFQQLEINGKSSATTTESNPLAAALNQQHQSLQQQQHHYQQQHHHHNQVGQQLSAAVPYNHYQQQQQQHHYQPQNQRRRRNSSNSKNDMSPNKPTNGSISPSATNSRFSTPGVRSLPLTPPSIQFSSERPPVAALSCPDGLAHALSEQNLRLQQIVYEHKLREEALQRELYATRLALLEKTCRNCSNQQYGNDDPTSMVDSIIENASNCSWEAVDERSAPSSGANSSQQITNSVLWVPDHAVSRCTICQTEFWLGRRKHHCRSCGQIFCADCSEYWATLPDEKLFTPVRMCRPCFESVSGKLAASSQSTVIHNNGSIIAAPNGVQHHQSNGITSNVQSTTTTTITCTTTTTKQHNITALLSSAHHVANKASVAAALMTSISTAAAGSLPNSLENCCKHPAACAVTSTSCSASANNATNADRGTCKATTATN